MPTLFDAYTLGSIPLANRIVMAPLTPNRAVAGLVPGPFAAPQLAVDGKIKESAISNLSSLIEHEPNGPDFLGLKRSLCAELSSSVPCRSGVHWIKCGVSHFFSPLAEIGQR